MPKKENYDAIRAKIIARAWKDPRFKERLLKNPREVVKEYGLDIPETMKIQCFEDTNNSYTFVLPNSFSDSSRELTEEELNRVVAGANLPSPPSAKKYPCIDLKF